MEAYHIDHLAAEGGVAHKNEVRCRETYGQLTHL